MRVRCRVTPCPLNRGMVSQEPSRSKRVRPLPAGGGRTLHEQAPRDAQLSAQDPNAHLRDLDVAAFGDAEADPALAADGPGEILLVVQLVVIAAVVLGLVTHAS